MTLFYLYSKFIKIYIRGKCVHDSVVHPTAVINSGSEFRSSSLGRYSNIGYDSNVVGCDIGQFCSIARGFVAGLAEHPIDWASTSPVFQNVRKSGSAKRFAKFDLPVPKRTVIGNDVWIGVNVIVKKGVRIGNGSVVGSGAVVTKDVPPYSIVAGVPARILRYRFDEETISALEQSEWWNLSDEDLMQVSDKIRNPKEFAQSVISLKNSTGGGYFLRNQVVGYSVWGVAV